MPKNTNAPDNISLTLPNIGIEGIQTGSIERIKKIHTLDDLILSNAGIGKNPKKDHPKFIELQKKQMLLGMRISEIKDPIYREIQKNISEIYEVKNMWSPELKELDIKTQKTIQDMRTSSGIQSELNEQIKKLLEQKNILMQNMYTSNEFQEYIGKNKSRIDELNEETKKYWTAEIIDLQKEVALLVKEIYETQPLK